MARHSLAYFVGLLSRIKLFFRNDLQKVQLNPVYKRRRPEIEDLVRFTEVFN